MKNTIRLTFALLALTPGLLFASAADRKIELTARASFNFRTILGSRVSVEAREGVVTLTGLVEDEEEKALAADTVLTIAGVDKVTNLVAVNSVYIKHSDPWIARKIHSRLIVKAGINASETGVTVKGGVATLTGHVATALQKQLTESYVLAVPGVTSVTNNLAITPGASGFEPSKEIIDDASITSQIKNALRSDQSTGKLQPAILTSDGVVTLTGEAGSADEKASVTKQAESVRGVKSVSNNMSVKA